MRSCDYCGKVNHDAAAFCTNCGVSLVERLDAGRGASVFSCETLIVRRGVPGPDRRPLVLVACVRTMAHRVFGCAAPPWVIDWRDTLAELVARAWVGLLVGGALCLLIIPVFFWPGRRGRPSLYDRLGEPGWIAWLFIVPVIGAILFQIASTRATVRESSVLEMPDHFYDL